MAFCDGLKSFFRLLRGYRPPRVLVFMLGACASAWMFAFWIGFAQPLEAIRECEAYRLKFGADPEYKIGLGDFHCEFRAEDIRGWRAPKERGALAI
jgi:hypothetical protein